MKWKMYKMKTVDGRYMKVTIPTKSDDKDAEGVVEKGV